MRHRQQAKRRHFVESLEQRNLLATVNVPVLVDGTATDYDLDGVFSNSLEGGATADTRYFTSGTNQGNTRGIFEFDASGLPAGTQLSSAKLVVDVSVLVTTTANGVTDYPDVSLHAFAGDGNVYPSDGDAPALPLGSGEVTDWGVREFVLDPNVVEQHLGQILGVRMQNPVPDSPWLAVALKGHPDASLQRARLVLETDDTPSLELSVGTNVINEADGAAATTATLKRSGDLTVPLTVTLASSDTSELTVPSSVTFQPGQSTLTFPVSAVDDDLLDGTQNATITATAQIPSTTPVGLDGSFGANGLAATRLLMVIQGPYAAMAVQPDGKIIAAGENGSGSSWRVTRTNDDGTLDTTFGNGMGYVDTVPSPYPGTYPVPFKVLVQPDGKFLVGGKFAGGTGSAALVRYNTNGTLDTTFGNSGKADLSNAGGWVEDIALRADGRIILVIAFNGSTNFRLVNLTANGGYNDPAGFIRNYTNIGGLARQIEMLADGKFIVAGSDRVAKFFADGSLDTSFGSGGVQMVTWGTNSDISEMAIDGLGRVVLAGHEYISNTLDSSNWTAARLTPDGQLDATFGTNGRTTIDFSAKDDLATTLALQPSGKILIGGYAEDADNTQLSAVVRLNDNGALDTSFNDDGRLTLNLLPTDYERIFEMSLTPEGQLVALTGFGNDYRLARFNVGSDTIDLLAQAAVAVRDNENHAPDFDDQLFYVDENSPPGTVAGIVQATDYNTDQTLRYELVEMSDWDAFTFDPDTREIRVTNSYDLDFESREDFTLRIRATDDAGLWTEAIITIRLNDVNDAPWFPPVTYTVAENSAAGTHVGWAVAYEFDANQTLTYAVLEGNESGAFQVDPQTGAIVVADPSQLDYESGQTFQLKVQATDNATPPLSATGVLTIQISNINERPIVQSASLNLAENTANGTTVGNVTATDPDAGQTLSYAILAGNTGNAFAISSTGVLTVANSAALNFETTPTFSLTVRVSDSGSPSLYTDAVVTISLGNVNEAPSLSPLAVSIAENSSVGTVVGTPVSSDPEGNALTYQIVSGNGQNQFAIDPQTGRITVANNNLLNFESGIAFTLIVRATDAGGLTAESSVAISLTNVNEAPVANDANFSLPENSANGTVVGTVTATDPDVGQSKNFAIVGGNTGDAFTIDSNGKITVANSAALDYETTRTFTLTVRVTDNGNPNLSDDATVVISLTDVAESRQIGIDVKPNDSRNEIVLTRDKKVQIALLSSSTFDARTIDLETLRIGRTGLENSIVRDKRGRIQYSLTDVNGDGRLDVVVSFDVAQSGLKAGDTQVKITAKTTAALSLFGSDTVTVKSTAKK